MGLALDNDRANAVEARGGAAGGDDVAVAHEEVESGGGRGGGSVGVVVRVVGCG